MKNTINIFKSHIARRCAALAGLVTLMLLFSSAAWGTTYYLIGGTSDNPDDSGNRWGNLATSSSLTFSVNLTAYQNTYMSISSDGTVSGISDYSTEGKSFSFDSSIAENFEKKDFGSYYFIFVKVKTTGTYTISYNGSTTYTLTSGGGGGGSEYTVTIDSHPHCTADSYEKTTSSGSVSFSVTADEGWNITSASATNGTASLSPVGGGTSVTVTVSSVTAASSISIVTAPVSSGKPIVLMGKNTSTNANCDVVASAYVAYTDCSHAINKFTIYYSNNRAFRTDGNNITHHKDFSGTAGINSTYDDLVIPADKVGEVVKPGSTLYLRVTASNNNSQTSVYSDIVPFQYSCDQFVTRNLLTETYTACPGRHQFTWTDMFQSPVPSECVKVELKSGSTYSEVKASDHFIRQGEQMVWVTEGKSASSYEYRLTAKSGSITGTALITISYTVPGTITEGDGLTKIEQTASITTPWTPVTFTAKGKNDSGDLTKIYWTSVPDATLSPAVESLSASSIEAESIFKAPVQNYSQNYTVTATAYTADCASSSVSTTIKVNPDNTDVCPAP